VTLCEVRTTANECSCTAAVVKLAYLLGVLQSQLQQLWYRASIERERVISVIATSVFEGKHTCSARRRGTPCILYLQDFPIESFGRIAHPCHISHLPGKPDRTETAAELTRHLWQCAEDSPRHTREPTKGWQYYPDLGGS